MSSRNASSAIFAFLLLRAATSSSHKLLLLLLSCENLPTKLDGCPEFSEQHIDPGGELYHFGFRPIIPRDIWSSITHVMVTHVDPDHHWHTDRLVAESDATVVCGTGLTQVRDAKRFMLEIADRIIVNLGDTLMRLDQWIGIPRPDVLMIPIGCDEVGNTMGIRDAIEVTKALRPRTVIPGHHNLPSFFKRNANPTDVRGFAEAVESWRPA